MKPQPRRQPAKSKPRRVVVTRSKTERCVVLTLKLKTKATAQDVIGDAISCFKSSVMNWKTYVSTPCSIVSVKTDVVTDVIRAGKKGGRR